MSSNHKSIYLSIAGVDPGWIVGKIADDINKYLQSKGIKSRTGSPSEYQGEDICYHLGYAYAVPEVKAKINSVFITHIDDVLKEKLLLSIKNKFDSFICMSSEDKDFLISLGFDANKVYGIPLPVRNTYVKPVSLGVFSSCYKDGRKNESWLLDFAKNNPDIKLLNFVFIGNGWSSFLAKFSELDCSFEWHKVNRNMPYEYEFQQQKLSSLDYYFYLGFDGGAMGSYDAYAYGNQLILINESYHIDIPDIDHPINSYDDFSKVLGNIVTKQKNKISFFKDNSVTSYSRKLLTIWENKEINNEDSNVLIPSNVNASLLKKRQSNYKKVTLIRFLGMIKRKIFKLLRID